MIDVVIVYELPQRELENALLMKAQFELDGLSCEIINYPFEDIKRIRNKYFNKVKCVMVVSLYDQSVLYHLVYSAFGTVKYVVNLQYEQVWDNATENDKNSYWFPKGIAKDAIHFCWGERPAKLFREAGVDEFNTPIVGPIQLDFLRSEFKEYQYDNGFIRKKYNIEDSKKIILFISSFSYAKLGFSNREKLIKKLGRKTVVDLEIATIETQKKVLEWFDRFLKEHSDYVIIYRKHPAEIETEILLELSEKNDRFIINADYAVRQWISVADVISVWYSTSIVEAYFYGKKFNILRPINMPYQREVVIMNDAEFTHDYQGFVDYIIEKEADCPIKEEIVRSYYDFSETPSVIRIGEYIKALLDNKDYEFVWPKKIVKEFEKRYKKQQVVSFVNKIKDRVAVYLIELQNKISIAYPSAIAKRLDSKIKTLEMIENKKKQCELLLKNEDKIKAIILQMNKKRYDDNGL